MVWTDPDEPLQISVLDRLLDANPERRSDPQQGRAQSLAALRWTVGRDLESLLNTRERCRSSPDDLTELDTSLVNYGIPDFTGANLATVELRDQFRATVEAVIRRYEPRFQSVRVVMLDNVDQLDRTLRFRIEALMKAEPAPEPVVYDSVMDPVSRTVSVTDRADD